VYTPHNRYNAVMGHLFNRVHADYGSSFSPRVTAMQVLVEVCLLASHPQPLSAIMMLTVGGIFGTAVCCDVVIR
jgi:hypothetical protein